MSKICLKRGFGWSRSYFSRETMRDSSLARSLVSQGWSREKSRSRKNPIDTLRDLTLTNSSTIINFFVNTNHGEGIVSVKTG